MNQHLSRFVAVSLVALLFDPALLFSQQQPAGVITTLQGTAELTRLTSPLPTALRFKDDVFVRDVINTKEKSLVRVLFGGKSTVTIRELSRLEIREEMLPGGATRSIHELSSGSIMINVAKQLMRPGDEVIIRTPNAVAAVRGTTLFVDCSNTCRFTVLNGNAELTPQGRTPVNLPANTTATVSGNSTTGTQLSPITPIPPAQVNQLLQQFDSRLALTQEAGQAQIAAAQTEQASQLARAIVTTITGVDPGLTTSTTSTDATSQETQDEAQEFQNALLSSTTSSSTLFDIANPTLFSTTAAVTTASITPDVSTVDVPEVLISETSINLGPGQTLKTFSGTTTRSKSSPVVQINNSTVSGPGNLLQVDSGASASLAGPVLDVTNSNLSSGGSLLNILGSLSSSGSRLINIDPTIVTANSDLIHVGSGGSLSLAGQLLTGSNSTFNINDTQLNTPITSIDLGAQPTSVAIISNEKDTGGVLDRLFIPIASANQVKVIDAKTNTILTTITLPGGSTSGEKVAFAAPNQDRILILDTNTNNVYVIDSHASSVLATVNMGGGAGPTAVAVTPDSNNAYVANEGTNNIKVINLDANTVIKTIIVGTGPDAVAVTPDGKKAYVVNNGDHTVSVINTSTNAVTGSPIPVAGTAGFDDALVITPNGSKVYVINSGSSTATVIDTATNATTPIAVGSGATFLAVTPNGSKVYVANSSSNSVSVIDTTTNSVVNVADYGGSGPNALVISKDSKRVYVANSGSQNVSVIDTATNKQIALVNTGPIEGLALFSDRDLRNLFTGSGNSTNFSVISTVDQSDFLNISGGSKVQSNGTLPFLEFDPSTVNTGGALVRVTDSGSSLTLSGPLVVATDTTFNIDSGALRIFNGGSLTGNGTGALIQLNGTTPGASTVNTVFSFASVADTDSKLTLAGPFLNATNTNFNLGPNASSAATQNLLLFEEGAAIKSTSASPFVTLTGSTVAHSSNLISLRRSLDNVAPAASMSLAGPLLFIENSSITTSRNLVDVTEKAILTGTGTAPLIQTSNSTFNIGDPAIGAGSSNNFLRIDNNSGQSGQGPATVNLAGPLLSDSGSQFTILDSLLAVFDGSTLTGTGTSPLIQFNGSTVTTGSDPILLDSGTDHIPPTMTLSGPLLSATNTIFNPGNTFMFVGDSATLNGPPKPAVGDAPALLSFSNSTINSSSNNFFSERRSLTPGTPTTVNLGGPLLTVTGSIFNNSGLILVAESAKFLDSGTTALVQSSGSTFSLTSSFLNVIDATTGGSPGTPGPATMTLASPLLSDNGSTFNIGSRFMTITGGSTLSSTSGDFLVQLSGSTVNTTSNFLSATSTTTPSTVNLGGGLLRAGNNSHVTSGVTGTNTNSFLIVRNGSTLTSTSSNELVSFSGNSSLTTAGNFLAVDSSPSAATPSTVSLAGPLLKGVGGSIFTSGTCCSFIFLAENGKLQSTGTGALAQFTGSAVTSGGDFLTVTDDNTNNTTPAAPSTMTLSGSLLDDAGSTFTTGGRFVRVINGSTLTSTSPNPLVQFSGSTVNTPNDFANIQTASAKMTLSGSLLSAGSTLNIGTDPTVSGDMLDINTTGQLVMNSSNPVLQFNGGTHTIGTADTTTNNTPNRILRLQGNTTAAGISSVTGLGTFRPVIGNGVDPVPFTGATNPVGVLIKATGGASLTVNAGAGDLNLLTTGGTTLGAGNAIIVDRGLLEATAPLINLIGTGTTDATASILTTAGGTIDLFQSKVLSLGSVIALDNGLITVNKGPLLTLRNGSTLTVTGDLLNMINGSKINVLNGPLILATGVAPTGTAPSVSTLNVSGALVNFGGTGGNKIIVNNAIAPTATLSGIPVSTASGGGAITIGPNPIKNPALGTVTVTGSLIQTTSGGKVTITAP